MTPETRHFNSVTRLRTNRRPHSSNLTVGLELRRLYQTTCSKQTLVQRNPFTSAKVSVVIKRELRKLLSLAAGFAINEEEGVRQKKNTPGAFAEPFQEIRAAELGSGRKRNSWSYETGFPKTIAQAKTV